MKSEKSIEQIALEEYARKELDKKYESIGALVGFIVGILSAISFVFGIVNCRTCFHDYAMIAFGAIIIAAITGMFAMACVVIFSLASRRNERRIDKFISLLSQKESQKIISDYLQKKIKSLQDHVPSCERKIQTLQLEVEKLKESIEESNQRIPELQQKLSKL